MLSFSFLSAAQLSCLVLFLVCARALSRAILLPLRFVPGPFIARFSRVWLFQNLWSGEFHQKNVTLHRRYGSVVRIAPNEYVIDSPDAVKVIYGHGAAFKKSDFYLAASNPESHVSDLFSDRDPKTHAQLRRKIASLYSMTNLLKIDAWMHECGNILVERFREMSRAGVPVDLQHWMHCYAVDVIGATTISKPFGSLDSGKDELSLMATLHDAVLYITLVGVYPELHRLLNSLMKHLSRSGIAEFFKLSAAQVQAGKEGKIPEREGFLTRMLQMHQQNESNMSFLDMMLVCVINLGAGSDNTSIGLTGTMWGLISNPEAMAKLRAEIDERTAAGDLSASSPIPYQVARCMPYLQAVIKEGLRLEGSPGIPLPRVVPQCGAEIAGHFFPGGTVVGINAYVLHRNKDIFGHDAEDFNPDRWLGDKEVVSRMDQHFLAFGGGSRVCIGKHIAFIELSTLIPDLVRKLDFELVDPCAQRKRRNVFFIKHQNLDVKITERGGW